MMKKGLVCLAAALVIWGGAGTVRAESVLDKVYDVWETKVEEAAERLRDAMQESLQGSPVSLGTMYTTGNLTLRAQATKESDKLAVVPVNAEVPVYDKSTGDYYQIEYKGQLGYVLGEYLTEDKEEAEKAEQEAIEEERKRAEKAARQRKSSSSQSYDDDDDDDYDYEEYDEEEEDSGSQKKNDDECLTGGILN